MVRAIAEAGALVERIVAEESEALVGSALLLPAGTRFSGPDGEEVSIQWPKMRLLAVPPASRGKGVGSALMDECIRRARRSGATAITLHTTDMMQTAMRMYERRGFVRAPETDFYPVPDVVIKGYRLDL